MKRTKLSSLVGKTITTIILDPKRLEVEIEDASGSVILSFSPDKVFDRFGNFFDLDGLPEREWEDT
jgi:hypothetical protein